MNAFFNMSEVSTSECKIYELSKKSDVKNPKVEDLDKPIAKEVSPEKLEKLSPIQNKIDGLRREAEVERELKEKYPEDKGYSVVSEAYLRDSEGKIVKDPVTGEARRIDFVVVKDGKSVDTIEVTSNTADKTEQTAKENRIRENGGNYIKGENAELIKIPDSVQTRIERRN